MYKIIPSERFEKSAKILLKKYKSLSHELLELGDELAENPTLGNPLGKSCYKVRFSVNSSPSSESSRLKDLYFLSNILADFSNLSEGIILYIR